MLLSLGVQKTHQWGTGNGECPGPTVPGGQPACTSLSRKRIQPGPARPNKAQPSSSNIKAMLTVVFDWEAVVHQDKYAPPGQTINKEYLFP